MKILCASRWYCLRRSGALALDEIAVAIVRALDGVKSLDQIADGFARDFGAPKDQVLADIIAFAQEFANRRMLEIVQ